MRIGIAGPIALSSLKSLFPQNAKLQAIPGHPLIHTLAERLHQRGHDIVLFTLSPSVTKTHFVRGNRIQAYICPVRRPRWQMLDFFSRERREVRNAIRQSRCDVVHGHWTYEFGAAAVDSGVPHVVTAHDDPRVVLRFARHPYWLVKPLLAFSVLR